MEGVWSIYTRDSEEPQPNPYSGRPMGLQQLGNPMRRESGTPMRRESGNLIGPQSRFSPAPMGPNLLQNGFPDNSNTKTHAPIFGGSLRRNQKANLSQQMTELEAILNSVSCDKVNKKYVNNNL